MIIIENLIKKLFDYQRFEKNKDLQKIINDIEDRYPENELLGDYQLSFVAGGKEEEKILDKDDISGKQNKQG